ncbi:rho GTPase-activating protein SYDE2-like [Xyrauchen texanus]|uniref:rho GTPase-activating protein SYDE2-like n=1 Tax=Xyrauchen texanus TaxID=154827 RepID=UPI00224275C2|nr:rho GTPase-activating protein SYDE2-like [Xyrauchen texanus]
MVSRAPHRKGLAVDPTAPSDDVPEPTTRQSCNDAAVAKHPGVTVNKMQEWMLKGRVLSSEMKQRIAGSLLRAGHAATTAAHADGLQASRNAVTGAPLQSAPMECIPGTSCVAQRGPCTRQTPFNHITVSKKRNWLHQSFAHPVLHPEDITAPPTAEEDHIHSQTHPLSSASPPKDAQPPGASVKPSRNSSQPPRHPDPAEENDADDEGEIWYNPIPEDEEGGDPRGVLAIMKGSGGATKGCTGGEGGCKEMEHSNDTFQLHRQTLACKTQEESLVVRATGKPVCLSSLISHLSNDLPLSLSQNLAVMGTTFKDSISMLLS